jgi:hypothetical protein
MNALTLFRQRVVRPQLAAALRVLGSWSEEVAKARIRADAWTFQRFQ